MRTGFKLSPLRLATMLALVSALAACTKGGQFDPTTLLDNDMFDNKKPLAGQREPVFPNGVPGATTGIPADLYKGYQPPPEQAADNGGVGAATPITPNAGEPPKAVAKLEAKPKPKPKPKPKLARAPEPSPTRISIGLRKPSQPAAQGKAQPTQTMAPAPASNTAAQSVWPSPQPGNAAHTDWPAPPTQGAQQVAQPSQSIWPAPPTGGAQPAAQPSQSIWPNPPATGGTSQ